MIRYSYLWRSEFDRGQEEGVKDRPCAVILVTTTQSHGQLVTVLPITDRAPSLLAHAVEIPAATCARLRFDDERHWIVLTEANRFLWPGPDLRFGAGGDSARAYYGHISRKLYTTVRDRFLDLARRTRPPITPRTE